MKSCAPARRAAVITRSIGVTGSASAIFSRIERLNRIFSCSTTPIWRRSEEHTSELQSLMRISYAVFCLKKKKKTQNNNKIDKQKTNQEHKRKTTNWKTPQYE